MVGYSDVDMASNVNTRKSATGVLFFLGLNPVTWRSQKQKVIALSSCEVEYIAGTTAVCQGVWLAQLLSELKCEARSSFTMKMDNQSAIALCKNPVHHDRSKHIDTRWKDQRRVMDERIDVAFVGTESQLADILTKPLGRTRFRELRGLIGVNKISGEHKV
jgi:hypothetical protein